MNTKMACPSEEKKNAYKKKFLEKSSAIAVREKVTVVKSPKETQEKVHNIFLINVIYIHAGIFYFSLKIKNKYISLKHQFMCLHNILL